MTAVPLADARDDRAELPVPDGFALAAALVAAVVQGDQSARAALDEVGDRLPGPLAVCSSTVGEDAADTSFAGQHVTVLNVDGRVALDRAVATVWHSAWSEPALGYRRRLGAVGPVCMGVVVQRLVAAEVAGVLFTRNPITGADELVIEASWGLGEAVVQSLVIPDLYRVARTGEVLERRPGPKSVALRRLTTGGTHAEPVEPGLAERLCLADSHLQASSRLALECDAVFGHGSHDIEWAFAGDAPYLLQRRPITTMKR